MTKKSVNKIKYTLMFFATTTLLGLSTHSQAYVMARSAMTVDDLQFSSSNATAELVWIDVWRGELAVQAQDTLSGTDADDAEIFGDNAAIAVNAATALAESVAAYSVENGPEVAKGGGQVKIITGSGLEINGVEAQASGEAGGTFDNFFVVTGGDVGDTVDVTFTLDYVYLFDAEANASDDHYGFYEVFAFAALGIDGLVEDSVLDTASGSTTSSVDKRVAGTLTVNATLEYGAEYLLFAEADSEVFGVNVPEPSTFFLSLTGLGLLILQRKRLYRI